MPFCCLGGQATGPATQGAFLIEMGITDRLERLLGHLPEDDDSVERCVLTVHTLCDTGHRCCVHA